MTSSLYEIRDPIHGTIVIDDFERAVVDHPRVRRWLSSNLALSQSCIPAVCTTAFSTRLA